MAKYQLRETTTVDAFVVQELSPDFHNYTLALLDDNTVKQITTGAAAPGEYAVLAADGTPDHFVPAAQFEAQYVPLAE